MSDIIFIHQLKVDIIIGIFPWEQQQKQPVLIDLEIGTDIRRAALSKKIKDTVDYAQVATRITDFVANKKFQLLETLAEEIAQLLFVEFKIERLKLQLAKPLAILNAKQVGVIIERTSEYYQAENKHAEINA